MRIVGRKELDELLDAYDRKLQCGKYDPLLLRRIIHYATAPYRQICRYIRLAWWWAKHKWWQIKMREE